MNKLILNENVTMSSFEIANLVESRHDSVKRTIERLSDRGVIRLPPMVNSEKINNLGLPQSSSEYIFSGEQGRRDSIVVVAQLCPEFTARLVDRWQELENNNLDIALPNFNNPAEAARAWADQYDTNIKLLAANQEQIAKIESLESLFVQGETIFEFCKKLNGVNANAVNRTFEVKNWLYNESKSTTRWRVKSYARDRYLTEETGNMVINGIDCITHKPVLLKKGAVRIYEMYLKNELPMKKDWNGSYTQDKHLGVA